MRLRQHLIALIVLLFAFTAAQAQLPEEPRRQTASIHGTVTDVNDDAVPHAAVVLEGPIGDRHTVATDANGFFELNNLNAGTYHLTASSKDFSSWSSAAIALTPGQNLDLPEITLQLATAMTSVEAKNYTPQEIATEQVQLEETQRLVGVIPNFYIVYSGPYAPLSAKQKFSLAWKSTIDPTTFVLNGIGAGIDQGLGIPSQWGKDWPGYGQRYGASFATGVSSLILTADVFPTLFHQDPRYFYKGTGSIRSRVFYAIATSTVVCKGDNGRWQPNISNVMGNFASAGLANVYYPNDDKRASFTIFNALIITGSDAISGLLQEFLLKHFTTHGKSHK